MESSAIHLRTEMRGEKNLLLVSSLCVSAAAGVYADVCAIGALETQWEARNEEEGVEEGAKAAECGENSLKGQAAGKVSGDLG